MLKKIVLLSSIGALLTGCASSGQNAYYQLPVQTQTFSVKSAIPAERQVQFLGVTLPDYLNNTGIVYQTSDVTYTVAQQNLWSGSLKSQVEQRVLANLNTALPQWLVGWQTTGSDKSLALSLNSFHGRYDGRVVIRGEWTYVKGQTLTTRPFERVLIQPNDGYESLVATLAQGLTEETKAMAQYIAAD